MSKPDASLVTQGKPKVGGAIFYAPVGTDLPESAKTELAEIWTQAGYVSDNGVVNTQSIETANTKAWGGDVVLNSQTGRNDEFKFKLIESLNPDVLKLVYGDSNVTGTLDTEIKVMCRPLQLEAHSFVIDMVQKGGILKRLVIPDATITAIGDITYKDDEAVGFDVTLGAVPGEDGQTHHEYIAKGGTA